MINQMQIVGRLGRDAEIRTLQSGSRVATFSVATSESWKDRDSGERKEVTQWHRVVTYQQPLIGLIEKRGKKGSLVFVQGPLTYRTWRKDGEASDRSEAELKVGPTDTLRFLEKADSDNDE